jgi:hypothetical protein
MVTYPLFARYLFLWMDNLGIGLDALREQPHIWPVRSDRGAPLLVDDHDIEQLVSRCSSGEFDDVEPRLWPRIPIGSRVTIMLGNALRHATVTHLLTRHRARIALDGSNMVVTVRVELLSLLQ